MAIRILLITLLVAVGLVAGRARAESLDALVKREGVSSSAPARSRPRPGFPGRFGRFFPRGSTIRAFE